MSHIRILFLTFIWTFAPELIQKGYIYASVPPLFRISQGKERIFLQDDAALADYVSKSKDKKYTVGRMKGCEVV